MAAHMGEVADGVDPMVVLQPIDVLQAGDSLVPGVELCGHHISLLNC